jgi:hypothetical protein
MTHFSYFPLMEKLLDKFANQAWLLKIIFFVMGGLAFHIKFISSFMGR